MKTAAFLLIVALSTLGASCRHLPEDRSAYAATAGQSTIVLGACGADFNVGWGQCLLEKGSSTFPTLRFIMTNPGEWAVGDCELGVYKTGSQAAKGVVEVDLSGLKDQAAKNGFCVLKIETVERYPDPRDKNQKRNIYMRGGLFIEMVDPGYFPTPANNVVAWCVKVARTTKGRTKIEQCKN